MKELKIFIKKTLVILGIRSNHHLENFGRRYSTTRYFMYNSIEKFIIQHHLFGKILLISERKEYSIRNMFSKKCIFISTEYPDVDITDLSKFKSNSFDVVVSDQVLEHVPDPFKACREIHRVLKKEGYAINTSCTFYHIHDNPDYFRFTKLGLRELHKDFKEIGLLGSWGNREVMGKFIRENYKSFDVLHNKRDYKLATINEETWPWLVWCIAQK